MRGSMTVGRAWRMAILGGLLTLAGCATPPGRSAPGGPGPRPGPGAVAENDPLFNDVPIPRSNAPGAATPGRGHLKPGLVPDAGGSTSPAALTRGPGAVPERRPEAGASIGAPKPTAPREGPGDIVQASATDQPAGGPETYEQLQEKLKSRGVEWQRLRNDNLQPGLWTFDCAIPDRNNRDIRRVFEGEGPGPLDAMRAALEQIDRERR
jgi:hypothetical protein